MRRLRSLAARRSSCRSSLRFAVARRCSLVGTAGVLLVLIGRQRVCQALLSVALPTTSSGMGNWTSCWSPDSRRACWRAIATCWLSAPVRTRSSSIRASGRWADLRQILDENHLTPAAVLLTHGHIDHIWSAQKVADMYGCPAYIHPDDRFMLTDPIKDFGPRGWLRSRSARCSGSPSRSSSWTRTATKLELGGVTVAVDHTLGHTRGSVVFRVD